MLGALVLVAGLASGCARARCGRAELAVQALGSGGPIPDDARASSAYLIWHEGRSRVLIDAGGGAFVRFAEAHASFDELDFVGLSHLHVDHVADLPALLKGGFFSDRERPLSVAGPSDGGAFPGLREWLELELGSRGAFRYLDWQLDRSRGAWSLSVHELDHTARSPITVELDDDRAAGIRVEAIGVEHGPVPALAYRVAIDDRVIVFSGDQNGDDPSFVEFARGADVLVMHHAVGEHPDPVAERLHARPSEIAEIAAAADVELLVLSHLMARSLAERGESLARVRERFDGRVEVAEDLSCYPLPTRRR